METSETTEQQHITSASIMLAVQTDSAFKLYAHRVISHEQYRSQIAELVGNYRSSIKSLKPKKKSTPSPQDNGQLSIPVE